MPRRLFNKTAAVGFHIAASERQFCRGRTSPGSAPCRQRGVKEILLKRESHISNLKSHNGQRAAGRVQKQGRLREARPRQNCLGLARALAGG